VQTQEHNDKREILQTKVDSLKLKIKQVEGENGQIERRLHDGKVEKMETEQQIEDLKLEIQSM